MASVDDLLERLAQQLAAGEISEEDYTRVRALAVENKMASSGAFLTDPTETKPVHAELPVGTKLVGDRFVLRKRLGTGRFGAVYLATDTELRLEVVLKSLRALLTRPRRLQSSCVMNWPSCAPFLVPATSSKRTILTLPSMVTRRLS